MLVLSLSLITKVALAERGNSGDHKPGWGWGDKNHEHDGPPGGPSVHPVHDDGDFGEHEDAGDDD